jgi:hypothetical protein
MVKLDELFPRKKKKKSSSESGDMSTYMTTKSHTHGSARADTENMDNNHNHNRIRARVCERKIKEVPKYMPYKSLPPNIRKFIKANESVIQNFIRKDGGFVLQFNSCYPRANWNFIKEASIKYSRDFKGCVFLFLPNDDKGFMFPLGAASTKRSVNLMSITDTGNFKFVSDFVDRRSTIVASAKKDFYSYIASIGGLNTIVFTEKQLKDEELGMEHSFEAMSVDAFSFHEKLGVPVSSKLYFITKHTPIAMDFSTILKDVSHIKSVQDMSLVWNYRDNQPLYQDIEVRLIDGNAFYSEKGVSALNQILAGITACKKTPWMDVLSWITGDVVTSARHASGKALTPSWYGEAIRVGPLFDARFVSMVDDFFRCADEDAVRLGLPVALHQKLGSIMNILDRTERSFRSGKGDVNLTMKSSFFGTDNFYHPEVIKKINDDDPATIRRFSFLLVSDETSRRASVLPQLNEIDFLNLTTERFSKIFGVPKPFPVMKKIFLFSRTCIPKVRWDEKTFKEIIDRESSGRDMNTVSFISTKAPALLKIAVIENELWLRHGLNFVARQEDFDVFQELLRRQINDFELIVRKGVAPTKWEEK